MTDKDAALRQALEALTDSDAAKSPHMNMRIAADFIRAALAAKVEPDELAVLDWNRLRAGDVRALDSAHQWAFDRLAAKVEPVAWRYRPGPSWPWSLTDDGYLASCKRGQYQVEELHNAAPPQRKPLTDEQVAPILREYKDGHITTLGLLRLVERKVRGEA